MGQILRNSLFLQAFHKPFTMTQRASIPPLAIAFLVGYAVDVFFPPWGFLSNWRHVMLGMTLVISSTRSSQVLCASLNPTTVLRVITPHDREGSEVSFHARHERAFPSRENEKDQK